MRIALLTIWHEKNYGAELQAYATIKVLQNLGHEVEMIDIRLSDMGKPSLGGWVALMIESISPCNRKFNNFWKKYIPTTKRYKSIEELKKDPPKADVYMVGSDQVWNPEITKSFSNLYFLDFGDDTVKRVSYASSFGKDTWLYDEKDEITRELLSKFAKISCREETGVGIVKNQFGLHATEVLDPTMLLDDYSGLTGSCQERNTIVFYPLVEDPILEACANKIGIELGCDVINNKKCTTLLNKVVWDRVSIEDWIKNIVEARFVITRSFHGVVFSIIHNKQFAVLEGNAKVSTRITNLLKKLQLEDRYFKSEDELFNKRPWDSYINYAIVDIKLNEFKRQSINYLKF